MVLTRGGRSWRQKGAGFFLALLAAACFYTEVLGLAFPFSCYFSPEILTGPVLHCHSGSVQMVASSDGLLMLPVSLNCRSHIMFYFLYITIEIICISLLCLLQQNVDTRRAGILSVCLSCVFLHLTQCLTHSKYSLNIFCINQKIMIDFIFYFLYQIEAPEGQGQMSYSFLYFRCFVQLLPNNRQFNKLLNK